MTNLSIFISSSYPHSSCSPYGCPPVTDTVHMAGHGHRQGRIPKGSYNHLGLFEYEGYWSSSGHNSSQSCNIISADINNSSFFTFSFQLGQNGCIPKIIFLDAPKGGEKQCMEKKREERAKVVLRMAMASTRTKSIKNCGHGQLVMMFDKTCMIRLPSLNL